MQRIKPKKSLGQNFLHDKNIARKMVSLFNPLPDEHILEIGPGTGMLTEVLIEKCTRLTLIEKDIRAIEVLQNQYGVHEHVTIIRNDILDVSFADMATDQNKIRVIGNIPYYITSPILFHCIDRRQHISDCMLLMQLEVARRITAQPSTPDYGILSVLTQTWATVAFLFKVPATVFYPRPSVESAVIHIIFDRQRTEIPDEPLYRFIVRGTFGKRRKMLRTSLKSLFPDPAIHKQSFSLDLNKRPENCTVNDFIQLTSEISNVINR